MRETNPIAHNLPGHNWTIPKLVAYAEQLFKRRPSRATLRTLLKQQGLSWKKCRKVLRKASAAKREAFVAQFQALFDQVCQQNTNLIYIDEVHIHRDMDLGYTWSEKGKPAYRLSECAPLADRINWYGAYNFTAGTCFIWHKGYCNTEHTVLFLEQVAQWVGGSDRPAVIIWDGAPWHRAKAAQQKAQALGFQLLPLPGYSPDLNPIEGLWKWLREETIQNHCYKTMTDLSDACMSFIDRVNLDPDALITRLWPKFELNPHFEKLLVS